MKPAVEKYSLSVTVAKPQWGSNGLLFAFVLASCLGLSISCIAMPPKPVYRDAGRLQAIGQEAADYEQLRAVLGLKDDEVLNVDVEYTENTRSTIDYLDQVVVAYRKSGNAAYAGDFDSDALVNGVVGGLAADGGKIVLPSEEEADQDCQVRAVVDIQIEIGSFSGDTSTVEIGVDFYDAKNDNRLVFHSREKGVGFIPYPAVTTGLGDAENMAIAHFYNRLQGVEFDETAELSAVAAEAAQSRGKALTEIGNSFNALAVQAGKLAEEMNPKSTNSSTASESAVGTNHAHQSREYYLHQYEREKRFALSMLGSLLHRTIVEDRLYGETGGTLGSRPNASLNVTLLEAFQTTQKRMRQIRAEAKRYGYDLPPSDVDDFRP